MVEKFSRDYFDYYLNSTKHSQLKKAQTMKPFLSFQGSRACPPEAGWFFQHLVYGGSLPPPHSLRQAQGCGFPHTQAAKRTAPSRQSLKKRFHGLAYEENATSKQDIHIFLDSLVTELRQ
jgi:hypothetical protein